MRFLGLAACLLALSTPSSARVKLQQPAPAFTLKTYAGKSVSLKDYKKQWVVLAFWWSNSTNPERYLKFLETIHTTYAKRGLVVIAINYDRSRGWGYRIWNKTKPSFVGLHDADNDVFDKYSIRMGGAVLLNPSHTVVHVTTSASKTLRSELDKHLGAAK